MSGAKVILRNAATNADSAASTNPEGYVVFSPIVRGTYSLTADKTGFKTVRLSDLAVNIDERRLVRINLEVAQLAETVEVTATVSNVQTEQGSLGQVITGRTAVDLPLAGRRYTELALLVPGVAPSTLNPVTRGPGWFVSNGNYHTQNNFLLDGIDNNQGTQNAQALSAQVVQPSPDSIAEFKVQTNSYSAEFGRSAGAVINVALKSGSNDVHGSGWYFNRHQALAATPWSNNLIGLEKPELRWHQFGGTVGGAVIRGKLFYFGSYEGFRQSFGETFLRSVPTADQRRGVFAFDITDPDTNQPFANRTIPANRVDALGRKIIDLYPQPNLPGRVQNGRPVDNYGTQAAGKEDTHKFDTRFDHYLREQDTLMFRFSFLLQEFSRDAIFPGLADGVGNQGTQLNDNRSLGASWTRTISPTIVNVARYGLNRTFAEFAHATAGAEKADSFGFRGIPEDLLGVGGLPLISPTNYAELGTRNFRPQFQKPWLNHILDTVSIQSGTHFVRTGFEARLKDNTFVDVTRRTPRYDFLGRYTGDAIADILLGVPESVQVNTVPEVKQLQQAYALFFQDDWKLSPNLTLNLGLRYEYTTPYYGSGENVNINFDPQTGNLITASDDDKYLVTPDRNNWGPRLGMAYQIIPQRLVFRGGYGIFYNSEDIYGSEANLPLNPPQLIQSTLQRQGTGPAPIRLSDPIPSGILDRFDSRNVGLRTRERDQRSGMIQQWNAAFEFQTSNSSTFEVAYVGNRGRNLFGLYQRNQTPFGVDGSIPANRPYPQWQGIQTGASRGRSWYDSLQFKFEQRLSAGVYALASYTYASALDEIGTWDAGNDPQILDNFRAERGPMAQTSRHRFSYAGTWQLPVGRGRRFGSSWSRVADAILGGWQLSGIVSWRSGLPIGIGLNGNGIDPATGQRYTFLNRNGGALRPDRVGSPNTGIDPKDDRLSFLNPAAFRVQTVNTPGNSSRNPAVGPRQFVVNSSLVKSFAVVEGHRLDLRWEAFNLFNTVNFNNPATTFGNTNFGAITSAGDPRVMQLAIRYAF